MGEIAIGRAKGFFLELFWIRRLDALTDETKSAVFQFFRWFARLAMIFYLITVGLSLLQTLIWPSLEGVIGFIIMALFFPIAFRLVMGLQIKFHTFWANKK